MNAITKLLDDLDAKAKAATPGPFHTEEDWRVYERSGVAIVSFAGLETTTYEDAANAAEYVAMKNSSAALKRIVRAVVERPWWRDGFEDDAGFAIWRCDGCDASKFAPGDCAPHREPCRYSAIDAALDAAEAEVKS
jgi:hypothetical protein